MWYTYIFRTTLTYTGAHQRGYTYVAHPSHMYREESLQLTRLGVGWRQYGGGSIA